MRNILFFLAFSFFATGSLTAQRFQGTWKRIVQPGNDPCATDMIIVVGKRDGPLDIWYGTQYEDCEELVESFVRWEHEREAIAGQRKKADVIYLYLEDAETLRWEIVELNSTFMKLRMPMYFDDGTEEEQELLFKRI